MYTSAIKLCHLLICLTHIQCQWKMPTLTVTALACHCSNSWVLLNWFFFFWGIYPSKVSSHICFAHECTLCSPKCMELCIFSKNCTWSFFKFPVQKHLSCLKTLAVRMSSNELAWQLFILIPSDGTYVCRFFKAKLQDDEQYAM